MYITSNMCIYIYVYIDSTHILCILGKRGGRRAAKAGSLHRDVDLERGGRIYCVCIYIYIYITCIDICIYV